MSDGFRGQLADKSDVVSSDMPSDMKGLARGDKLKLTKKLA